MFEADEQELLVMLQAVDRIAHYVEGYDVDRFFRDQRTIDAVAMNLLVIGECASQLSDDLKAKIGAPWPRTIGMRHRSAHGYTSVRHDILWNTANERAPELRRLITTWLERR